MVVHVGFALIHVSFIHALHPVAFRCCLFAGMCMMLRYLSSKQRARSWKRPKLRRSWRRSKQQLHKANSRRHKQTLLA